jgi:diguanylate cyclase (GGDEF)-like protein
MLLDIRTVIAFAAGLGVLMALSLRYVLRDYPAMLGPSMREWMLGVFVQAVSWLLVALRGAVPDFLSVVIANALLSVGYALLVDATRRFVDMRPGDRVLYALVIASVCVQVFFTYEAPSTRVRILIGSSLFAALLPLAWLPLLRAYRQSRRRSYLLTAAAFATLFGIMLLRVGYEFFNVDGLQNAFLSTPMQAFVFASLAFFPAVATLGFLLMCSSRLYQELERQATVDSLTGINNRRTLGELASRAIAAAHRHRRGLAVLLIDADHFKRVNDAHGHAIGDEALQLISTTLQCALRAGDLLGRLGGEEFVVILPEADESAACASAERLRQAVEQTEFSAAQRAVPLCISVGVAMFESGDDFASLLRRADQAMYAAKRGGRNRVVGPSDLPVGAIPASSLLAG